MTDRATLLKLPLDQARKDEIIDTIVEKEVELNQGDDEWFVKDLLRAGCKGYDNETDEKLVEMYEQVVADEEEDQEEEDDTDE